MTTRALQEYEIQLLEQNGCQAEQWSLVRVADPFIPTSVRDTRFAGQVELGRTGAVHPGGETGILRSFLHNVRIGGDCLIVDSRIANSIIGDGCAIVQVGELSCDGEAAFAHGIKAHILTEDGARSIPLWRRLSSQAAHVLCHYKGTPAASGLLALIESDRQELCPARSVLEDGCRVERIGRLHNIYAEAGAVIGGAGEVEDCYIASAPENPARIGQGVILRHCVILAGSRVTGNVVLDTCLVGEGVTVVDGFTGKHSLFFANSEMALGEADAAMAGPLAVSSHKASLVLTCQTSFSTFGSGSNSSNHHFKLGPRHGGVLRRGVKCGSGSYLLWPCDIGAYSTVVGKHRRHLDTAAFPFSLVTEDNGRSVLVPGVSVFSAGTERDRQKWLVRDNRHGIADPLDLINPAILSPYVLEAMERGMDLLRAAQSSGGDVDAGGAIVPASRIAYALEYYENALTFYLGQIIVEVLGMGDNADATGTAMVDALSKTISCDPVEFTGWRDWGGMLLPGAAARSIIDGLAAGSFDSEVALRQRLRTIHARYDEYAWQWVRHRWLARYGQPAAETAERFLHDWRKAVEFRHRRIKTDAEKEFSSQAMIGYGVELPASDHFAAIQGRFADHPLVQSEKKMYSEHSMQIDRLIASIPRL